MNNGVGTTCRSCENSGRECSYPSPLAGVTRRRESLSGKQDGGMEGERRPRARKSTHTFVTNPLSAIVDPPKPLTDALDPRLLTPTVWQELFDIFQVHYSADLPFLHPPTFLKPLRQASMQPPSTASAESQPAAARPPGSLEFLLAFLALTARFHPRLVAHHSPATSQRASNPMIASEYYSAAAHERMALMWSDNRVSQGIEWIQAALMLGLHEWGMCRGYKAWLTIGSAIRAAQAMGLQYELELDDEPMSRSLALNSEAERLGVEFNQKGAIASVSGEEDIFVQQEVRRRTFWSCFIMDRYLSSGKYRPQMLHARELRIQLPVSERSFLFAEKVRTLMLGEEEHKVARAEVQSHRQASVALANGDTPESRPMSSSNGMMGKEEDKGRLESDADEGLVSRYIKILEIYGRVVQWSCAGGRRLVYLFFLATVTLLNIHGRIEEHPPWDPRCEWNKLHRQCLEFKASLPRQHALTPQNTQAHISLKTSTPYTLVHTVYLLCQIMLHREYVPFIPLRCAKPEGPLDPPRFPAHQYDVPAGFWQDSAQECFKAARDIMDLVRSCEEWNALVETPIVGFAIYTVAFVGVYCINFPWMDPNGYMCTSSTTNQAEAKKSGESPGIVAAKKALEMIGHMRLRLNMATGWFSTINRMHQYFVRMKKEYRKNIAASAHSNSESDGSPLSTRHLSLREGGEGGGLDEFKLIERTLKEFGALEDQDVEMADAGIRPSSRSADALCDDSSAGTTVKSEDHERRSAPAETHKADCGPWNAINAIPGSSSSRQASISTPTNGQFRTYDSYSHHPQQPHLASHHQNSAHHINNFRPVHSGETVAAPPSLTSPASHATSMLSQSSPPFERQPLSYGAWTTQNTTYPMAPPPQQASYSNGIHHQNLPHPQALPPMHSPYSAQHSSHPSQPQQQQSLQAPLELHEPPQVWDSFQKEQWLDNLQTRMSADDLAAFVDGGDIADWATRGQSQAGWLTAVWNHGVSS